MKNWNVVKNSIKSLTPEENLEIDKKVTLYVEPQNKNVVYKCYVCGAESDGKEAYCKCGNIILEYSEEKK